MGVDSIYLYRVNNKKKSKHFCKYSIDKKNIIHVFVYNFRFSTKKKLKAKTFVIHKKNIYKARHLTACLFII